MKKINIAIVLEGIAKLFAGIWIVGGLASIYFLIQTIRGVHPWWYIALAIGIAWFCKALARRLQKESEKALYKATGIDYPQEWFDLHEAEKLEIVAKAFKDIVPNYFPDINIDTWLTNYEKVGTFDDMVRSITDDYRESGLKKPYQIVCPAYVDKFIKGVMKLAGSKTGLTKE